MWNIIPNALIPALCKMKNQGIFLALQISQTCANTCDEKSDNHYFVTNCIEIRP